MVEPTHCHYTEWSYGYSRVTFSLFILLLFLPITKPSNWFHASVVCTPQNPFHITQQETGSLPLHRFSMNFFLLLIAHIFPLPYSKFQIFFLLPTDRKPYIQWQTQNPPLSTPPTTTKWKNKSNPKENPTISYSHKKKKFSIINTTTNHTNPPPSQPKLQTTTTNTENPSTPTQNLQIGDPKLPT